MTERKPVASRSFGRTAGWVVLLLAAGGTAAGQQAGVRRVTLEEALRLAYLNNPVSVAAEASVQTAEASKRETWGAFLPGVTVNGIFTNSSNQRFDQASGRLVSTSYTAQTQGSYDLFTAGRKVLSLRTASARLDAADASLQNARFATALSTTSAFYETAAASELVKAAERRLERALQQMVFAETRLEVGTATRSDVLRAEIERGNAELAVIEAQSSLRTARLGLGRQIGTGGEAEPADPTLPEVPPALPPADSLATLAARTSPSVLAAEASLAETKSSKLSSYSFYLPTLRLTGGYDWFAPTYPPTNRSWSVRLVASLPVFNGFQREATVSRAAAAEHLAAIRAQDAAIGARAEAIDAAQRIEAAGRRVAIARRSVELAQEDLRVQEERYQISAATIIDLQTSQVALAVAESNFVRAKQQLGVAIAELEAVLGERIASGN